MKRKAREWNEDKVKRLKFSSWCIIHAHRLKFEVDQSKFEGYHFTVALDNDEILAVMNAANGFWPRAVALLVCGYIDEQHTYKCGIETGGKCCEQWGLGIKGVRPMASGAAEQQFLADLVGKSFKGFRWSLDRPNREDEKSQANVELILESDNNAGREVVTFTFWNIHNGFYPHNVVLMHDSRADVQSV